MATRFTEIPILDLSRAHDPVSRSSLIQEVRAALLDVGFLYIKNHGVAQSTVQEMQELLPRLFSLPAAQKNEVALINSPHFLGYSNFGSEVTAKTHDEREQFEFASEASHLYDQHHHSQQRYNALYGPSQWPKSPSDCRSIVTTYFEGLIDLSLRFLELIAEAFELPPTAFDKFVSQQHRLKVIHSRPLSSSSCDSQSTQGVGPHKDSSGWLTFLLQGSDSSVRGLQALTKSGEWIDVPPVQDTFVVNAGQAFEVLTNGLCKATTHRVLLPPGDYDRYSVPFFQGVRLDTTREEFRQLWQHFETGRWQSAESAEAKRIDSPFLSGRYDKWGESQLRTKIRSHQDVGKRFYPDLLNTYANDDISPC